MSRMSDLWITISEMLEEGMEPLQVANLLGVPIQWVLDVEASMKTETYG